MVGYGNESDAPLIAAGEELGRRNPGISLRVIGGTLGRGAGADQGGARRLAL